MQSFGRVAAALAALIIVVSTGSLPARTLQAPAGTRASGGKVLFEDDVRSTTWNPVKDGECVGVQGDGGYIVRGASASNTCRLLLPFAGVFSGDLRLETTVRLRQGDVNDPFGLIFASDGSAFHKFAISGEGSYLLNHIENGVWTNLVSWTRSPAVRQGRGASNRLTVEIRGRQLQVFANGQLLTSATAPYDLRGKIGFYVNALDQEVVFSDVRVTDISSAGAISSLPTAPNVLTSGGRTVVDDDMATSKNFAVGRTADCIQEYTDGGYVVESPGSTGCVVFLFNAGAHPVHLRYEVSARVVRGGEKGFGMIFGAVPGENYIYALTHGIITGTFELGRTTGAPGKGSYTALIPVTGNSAVRTGIGSTNRIAVEINGRDIRLFLNGMFLQSHTAPTAPQGQMGIGAVGGARVVFTNFKVIDFVASQTTSRRAGEGVGAVQRTLLRGAAESMAGFRSPSTGGRQPDSTGGSATKDAGR